MNEQSEALKALNQMAEDLTREEKDNLEQVVNCGLAGYTCAQIIYRLIAEQRPDAQRDEAVTRALGIFNRGMASYGEICGIVVGGAAALGSLSPEVIKQIDDPMWRKAQFFIEEFETDIAGSFASMKCSDIRSRTAREGKNNTAVCAVLLARAVTSLKKYIDG